MIKVNNLQVLNSVKSYHDLMGKDLPVRLGFRLRLGMKSIQENADAFNKVQETIVQSCGLKNDDGTWQTLPSNKNAIRLSEEGQKKVQELLNIEVELPLDPVHIDELGDITIPGNVFVNLDWLIVE